MAFQLREIVPWGRSFTEYKKMLSLSEADLDGRILGCGDGPASFNAELKKKRGRCVSIDPIYQFSKTEIKRRIDETFDEILAQLEANKKSYVWHEISSVEHLGKIRRKAMDDFLLDYEEGKSEGRYVAGNLPHLHFDDHSFDLALSSHFLFLYSDHLDLEFHIQSLEAMLRVAKEIRIFPLIDLKGTPSSHLSSVKKHFEAREYQVHQKRVPYEFQRGADQMLVIK